MSIYCQQCETENEDSSKFCKSCGAALHTGQKKTQETEKPINQNTTMQTVKKVAKWISIIIGAIVVIKTIVVYVHSKKEDLKIKELRTSCAENNVQACYELGISYYSNRDFQSEPLLETQEKRDALSKACRLGSGPACYESGMALRIMHIGQPTSPVALEYFRQGCILKDGKSCWWYGNYQLSCEYGYEDGCSYSKVYSSEPLYSNKGKE